MLVVGRECVQIGLLCRILHRSIHKCVLNSVVPCFIKQYPPHTDLLLIQIVVPTVEGTARAILCGAALPANRVPLAQRPSEKLKPIFPRSAAFGKAQTDFPRHRRSYPSRCFPGSSPAGARYPGTRRCPRCSGSRPHKRPHCTGNTSRALLSPTQAPGSASTRKSRGNPLPAYPE